MKPTIVLVFILLSAFEQFSEAQKAKEYGDILSYPYIGRVLAASVVKASDVCNMGTFIFPEVGFSINFFSSSLSFYFYFSNLKEIQLHLIIGRSNLW